MRNITYDLAMKKKIIHLHLEAGRYVKRLTITILKTENAPIK